MIPIPISSFNVKKHYYNCTSKYAYNCCDTDNPPLTLNPTDVSCAATTWTDSIPDRFTDQKDDDLATSVPGWSKRVEERLKARVRPNEDVAGPDLKSWLQGAGFWDVSC